MESCSMEIKVRYCRDLKTFNFFQKLSVYATASIKTDDAKRKPEHNQQQSTPIDEEGDGNPEWNHKIRFNLDEAWIKDPDHMFIHFEVHAIVVVLGNKIIGEAHIPLKDLIDESNGIARFVNYEVRGLDGKVNGMLTFSYKVNRKGSTGGKVAAIDGYSVVNQPSHEVLYPKVEVDSDYPPPKVEYSSSMESSNLSTETSSEAQHTSHEAHYPSRQGVYYPSPPPKGQHSSMGSPYSSADTSSEVQHTSRDYPSQLGVHYPQPPKGQHPSMESPNPSADKSSEVQHTSHEVHYPPKGQHQSMESPNPSADTSSEVQHTSHEAHYPSPHGPYYPPPPPYQLPPPPPMMHHPPPPPHLVHGGFFHPPPPPPPILHWPLPNNHDSRGHGSPGGHSFERSDMSNNGEMWHNGSGTERQWHPSPWNGR